jgi:hypothetical protein
MPEELTKEQEEALQNIFDAVAKDLAAGKSKEKITKELVKLDWPEEDAIQLINQVEEEMKRYQESPEGKQALAQKYLRHMGYGALWAIGGTIVTVVTYEAASSSSSGGSYVIAWGAILFGVIDFFRGLFGWMANKD